MDTKTIDTYNQSAQTYDDETAHFWELFPRTFLDTFIKLSGTKVLDVGSGPGRDGLLLQEAGKEVIGLDASEAMVQLSRKRGLQTVLADFSKLPFEDGSFDAVWSYTSFLHVPKSSMDAPLEETHRVLRPQGFFALGLIEGAGEEYRTSGGMDAPRWFSFYQKEEVVNLCEKHGFELVQFDTFKPGSRNYLHFMFRKK